MTADSSQPISEKNRRVSQNAKLLALVLVVDRMYAGTYRRN
jgi:hypothetical protein